MQQYSLSLDSDTLTAGALLVREADGAVRAASRKEILTVARELVNVDELPPVHNSGGIAWNRRGHAAAPAVTGSQTATGRKRTGARRP
ncbi:hypothetical protein [Pollutimonas bauzanensis]|uniref:hypothetical protein n=1 Tax=Pollutimonas bauzanensis TaxID=658167 RepID=UPI001160BA49|nr:hypothetical protein [Pollutimonas bauzanensis]